MATPKAKRSKGIIFTMNIDKLLDGTKTQTRREVKLPTRDRPYAIGRVERADDGRFEFLSKIGSQLLLVRPPHRVGETVYVKESVGQGQRYFGDSSTAYKADWVERSGVVEPTWKSPLFMEKRFARLWLRIITVRVNRVRDISDEDIVAEGFATRAAFESAWRKLNGEDLSANNAWCWVYGFRGTEPPSAAEEMG